MSYRPRDRSYSPPRQERDYSPRGRYRDRSPRGSPPRQRPEGNSLMVRNLSNEARADDLRYEAERIGPVRDVYIPLDYYTKRPRGIAFIEFADARDADTAVRRMDRLVICGREIAVNLAMKGRRARSGQGPPGGDGYGRRRSRSPYQRRSRSPRRRSYSRSRSPRRDRYSPARGRSPARDEPPQRRRSRSPQERSPARDE